MKEERYLFFSSLGTGEGLTKEMLAEFDFDNGELPILLADTQKTSHKTKFTDNALNEMKDRIIRSGHNKIFSGHDYSGDGPGTRNPKEWVASLNANSLKVIDHKGGRALVGKFKALGGTESRTALRESIKQDPDGVRFSVDVQLARNKVKYIKEDGDIIQLYDGVAGYSSIDWVTYGAIADAGLLFQQFSEGLFNELKEVKRMTKEEFKELHPEEYKKLEQEVGAQMSEQFETEKSKAVKDALKDKESLFESKMAELSSSVDARIKALEDESKAKDKKIAKLTEEKLFAQATGLMDEILQEAKEVKPYLFAKIKKHFDYSPFIKEDVLDEAAMKAAFAEDVKTWQFDEKAPVIKGGGHIDDTEDKGDLEKDIELGRGIFSKYFSKKK